MRPVIQAIPSNVLVVLDRTHIVVVTDIEDHAANYRRALARAGFVVTLATSAASALAVLRERPPQCIVIDVRLPDVTGPAHKISEVVMPEKSRERADAQRVIDQIDGHVPARRPAINDGRQSTERRSNGGRGRRTTGAIRRRQRVGGALSYRYRSAA